MMRGTLTLVVAALAVGTPAWAQQMTQPSANQNQSQVETNQQQQPKQQHSPVTGQSVSKPSASMNQPQIQTNASQQPPQAKRQPSTAAAGAKPNPLPELSR